MRVLVTGHRGYLGMRLTPLLLAAGHEVVGIDLNLYQDCGFGSQLVVPDVPPLGSDLADGLAEVQAIVQLAGFPDDPDGRLGQALPYHAERAALHLAERARRAGVERYIACGTTAVYAP